MIRRIHICSDSRAEIEAIAALAKTTTESLVWESKRAPEKLSGSHTGTPGIMEYRVTKRLINWPRKGVPSDQTIGIPFVVGNEVFLESFETGTPEQVENL